MAPPPPTASHELTSAWAVPPRATTAQRQHDARMNERARTAADGYHAAVSASNGGSNLRDDDVADAVAEEEGVVPAVGQHHDVTRPERRRIDTDHERVV